GGHVANANGYDIGFYADSSGSTKLKWEINSYNPSTGQLIAWVKIPTLSSTTDTSFYLFYGDPSITSDQSDPLNTWDSNFKAVYHLGDGTILTATDSTGGNNGTLINSPTAIAGKISGAVHLVSTSSQYISLANPGDFPVQTAWTAEGWFKPATDANMGLFWGSTSNNGPHLILPGNNTWRIGFWGGASTEGGSVNLNTWQHIMATFCLMAMSMRCVFAAQPDLPPGSLPSTTTKILLDRSSQWEASRVYRQRLLPLLPRLQRPP